MRNEIKCEVVIDDSPAPPQLAHYSNSHRTAEQVQNALTVLLAGEGIFWEEPSSINGMPYDTIWFHDGILGWHLSRKKPEMLTTQHWSYFAIAGMDKGYKRIPSPFAPPTGL